MPPIRPLPLRLPGTVRPPSTRPPGTLPGAGVIRPPQPPAYQKPLYDITIEAKPGAAPRTTDVTVNKGFDGLTPDEAAAKVKSQLQTSLYPRNERFLLEHTRSIHRDFTVGVSNVFVWNSPPNNFLSRLGVNEFKVLGTMRGSQPVVYEVRLPNQANPTHYARNAQGQYVVVPAPQVPVVMEAFVRLKPAGVAIGYPGWHAPVLSGETANITEL